MKNLQRIIGITSIIAFLAFGSYCYQQRAPEMTLAQLIDQAEQEAMQSKMETLYGKAY